MQKIFLDIKFNIFSYIFTPDTFQYLISNKYNFKPNLHDFTIKAFNEKNYLIVEDLIYNGIFDSNINSFYKNNFIFRIIKSKYIAENIVLMLFQNYQFDFDIINKIVRPSCVMLAIKNHKFEITKNLIPYSNYHIINDYDHISYSSILLCALRNQQDDIVDLILSHELFDTEIIRLNPDFFHIIINSNHYTNYSRPSLKKFISVFPFDKFLFTENIEFFYIKIYKFINLSKLPELIKYIIYVKYYNKILPFYKLLILLNFLDNDQECVNMKEEIVFNIIVPKYLESLSLIKFTNLIYNLSNNSNLIFKVIDKYLDFYNNNKPIIPSIFSFIIEIIIKYNLDMKLCNKLCTLKSYKLMDKFNHNVFFNILKIIQTKRSFLDIFDINIIFNKINYQIKNLITDWLIYSALVIGIETLNKNIIILLYQFNVPNNYFLEYQMFIEYFENIFKWICELPISKDYTELECAINIIKQIDDLSKCKEIILNSMLYTQVNFTNTFIKLADLVLDVDIIRFLDNLPDRFLNYNYSVDITEKLINKQYFKSLKKINSNNYFDT